MRPYILRDVKLDTKRMIIKAITNHGVYEYPILPALEDQVESNIIGYERGKRVIRSKDYSILKNANNIINRSVEIRCFHELMHDDIRVICPMYSTFRFLKENNDDHREIVINQLEKMNDFIKEELEHYLGKKLEKVLPISPEEIYDKILCRSENLFEDTMSVGVLEQLGWSREEIIRALKVDETWKSIILIGKILFFFVTDIKGVFKKRKLIRYLPLTLLLHLIFSRIASWSGICRLVKLDLVSNFEDVDMSKLVDSDPIERLSTVCWGYDALDYTYFKFLKDELGIKIDKDTQIEWVKEKIEVVKDPFMKLRWILEYQRLTTSPTKSLIGKRIDLNEAIKLAFINC